MKLAFGVQFFDQLNIIKCVDNLDVILAYYEAQKEIIPFSILLKYWLVTAMQILKIVEEKVSEKSHQKKTKEKLEAKYQILANIKEEKVLN